MGISVTLNQTLQDRWRYHHGGDGLSPETGGRTFRRVYIFTVKWCKMCNANMTHHVPTHINRSPDMTSFFAQVDRLNSTPVTNMFAMSMWHIRLSTRSEFIAWKQVGVRDWRPTSVCLSAKPGSPVVRFYRPLWCRCPDHILFEWLMLECKRDISGLGSRASIDPYGWWILRIFRNQGQ